MQFGLRLKTLRNKIKQDFAAGLAVPQLIKTYTRAIDDALQTFWQQLEFEPNQNLCLIASGGYGRGELLPYSDIDIVILSAKSLTPQEQKSIERFVHYCWDSHLQLSQNVLSLTECLELAKNDITVMTSLLESRLLSGDKFLYQQLQQELDTQWSNDNFFQAKWQEQQRRYKKYDHTAYNLEPNIKQGPGGLRDIHTIAWVAKKLIGANNLNELVSHDFLTSAEFQTLLTGQYFLWRVQFALHLLTSRSESRLLFDHQQQLAQQFGYKDQPQQLAIEQLMKDYYRTIKPLRELNDMLLQLFREVIITNEEPLITPLNERFRIHNHYIEVTHDDIFKQYPETLLEIFLLMAQHPEIKGVRANTIRLIRQNKNVIDDSFREKSNHCQLFITLLRQSGELSRVLQRMNRYGVLAKYLPAFDHTIGLMQYDLFHVYTVDQHTLFVIRNICRFTQSEYRGQFSLCADIFEHIAKREILYLAALFHDIAKGKKGNHSSIGSLEAHNFCKLHGLPDEDCTFVAWLVEHHLLMSSTAQREDVSDPTTIQNFIEKVTTIRHLDYLYLLTVADICATNPSLWNSWKDSLLKELYSQTKQCFENQNKLPSKDEIINEKQTVALTLLSDPSPEFHEEKNLWKHFPRTYFLQESPAKIAWLSQRILEGNHLQVPLVLTRQYKQAATEFLIYTKTHNNLFTISTTVLTNNNLDIVEARLYTLDNGYTLTSYIVLDEHQQCLDNERYISHMKNILIHFHKDNNIIPRLKKRRMPRHLHHFPLKPGVKFENDDTRNRTIMEITTLDKPGLLARIGKVFLDCGVLLHYAKVITRIERVDDRFFITDKNNQMINNSEQIALLQKKVLHVLTN